MGIFSTIGSFFGPIGGGIGSWADDIFSDDDDLGEFPQARYEPPPPPPPKEEEFNWGNLLKPLAGVGELLKSGMEIAKPFVPLLSGATSAYGAYEGQQQANETNIALADKTMGFNADQANLNRMFQQASADKQMGFQTSAAQVQREFEQASAQRQMDFQGGSAQKQMDFQQGSLDKQMAFQERMAGSSYQRAVHDLRSAGLNPMLAYQQGGAASPSGGAGSGASATGASARGTAPAGASAGGSAASGVLARIENAMAPALNSGNMAARVYQELQNMSLTNENLSKQGKFIDAQTALARANVPRVEQETTTSNVSASLMATQKMKLSDEMQRIGYEIKKLHSEKKNIDSQERMRDFERERLQPLMERYMKLQTQLMALEVPGGQAHSSAWSTWYGQNIRPFMQDVFGRGRGVGSGLRR